MSAEGGSRQYSKFKETTQGTSTTNTQETANTTVDVVFCVIEINEVEEDYKDGKYDSSNQIVQIDFNEESFGDEDVIEIFNENGSIIQKNMY
jgi:hypothetical protein